MGSKSCTCRYIGSTHPNGYPTQDDRPSTCFGLWRPIVHMACCSWWRSFFFKKNYRPKLAKKRSGVNPPPALSDQQEHTLPLKETMSTQNAAFHIHSHNILHCFSGTHLFLPARKRSSKISEREKLHLLREIWSQEIWSDKSYNKILRTNSWIRTRT